MLAEHPVEVVYRLLVLKQIFFGSLSIILLLVDLSEAFDISTT